MSETEDQIIKTLMTDVKELRYKNEELQQRTVKKDWFSGPMLMAYVAVLGVLGTNLKDCLDAVATRQKAQVVATTNDKLGELILGELGALESRTEMQFEAIISSLPTYQQHRIERKLESLESGKEAAIEEAATPAHSVRTVAELSVDSKEAAAEEAPVKLEEPTGLFTQIQQQVEDGELDNRGLKAAVQEAKRSHGYGRKVRPGPGWQRPQPSVEPRAEADVGRGAGGPP